MTLDELEILERTTFEMVVQAITDFYQQSVTIFREEQDLPGDIAEDVMREAIEEMGFPSIRERLYGKVDYKRAIYVFLPQPRLVALMLDAKAEKGNTSATIQMSQTSMRVRYTDSKGKNVDEKGKLPCTIITNNRELKVVTIIAKYVYSNRLDGGYDLIKVVMACIPNGELQERYNSSPDLTFWRAGRHSPECGEDFRVRLSFKRLRAMAQWRVRYIN